MSRLKPHLIPLGVILIIGLIQFAGFFGFTPWGDDWQILYGILHDETRSYLTMIKMQLLWPYGGQSLFMYIVYKLFGMSPFGYFLGSFVLRYFAATSIYFLTRYITHGNRWAGLLAGVLFISSSSGIESTNWVDNSINYLSLALTCWGFIYLKGSTLWSLLYFSLALLLAPVRMHGLLILLPLAILLNLNSKKNLKHYGPVLLIFGTIVLLFKSLNLYGAVGSEIVSRISYGALPFLQQDPSNIYKVFIYPIGSFFNSFIPTDVVLNNAIFQSTLLKMRVGFIEGLVLLSPMFFISWRLFKKERSSMYWSLGIILLFTALLALLSLGFPITLGLNGAVVLLGSVSLSLVLYLLVYLRMSRQQEEFYWLIILLSWPIAFVLTPHLLQNPGSIIEHHSRYMTISSGGTWILVSYIIYILYKNFMIWTRRLLPLFIGIVLVCNLLDMTTFYHESASYRVNAVTMPMWKVIYSEMDKHPYQGRSRIVLIIHDNQSNVHGQLTFGGHFRYAIYNDIFDSHHKPWFIINDGLPILKKAFDNPKISHDYWGPIIDDNLKLDDIIGFRVVNGQIIPDTDNIRKQLLLI